MDAKTLDVLEWQALKELLSSQASHALGRDRCGTIAIETKLETVSQNLRMTGEAADLLLIAGGMPTGGILDIRQALKHATAGAMLGSDELLAIASTLKSGKRLKEFLAERKDDFPSLWELAEPIAGLGELAHEIEISFDQAGEVADGASAELASIRRKLRELQARVRQTLQRIISQQASALQDPIITLRSDRYVLPVRADAKSQVPGIVHDQSATGQTLYIEPMAVLDANNSLKQAQIQERAEIERILYALSAAVAERQEPLGWNLEALGELEFAQAKGRLARLLDGSCPRLSRDGRVKLYKARHPLLVHRLGAATVPIDVSVGDEHQVLLITGPNTGGKTVTLKTLGMCVLMTQAGLYPPVAPGSQVGLMRAVFADIGDEQSLEQSLSTFSGHLKNIIRILSLADDRTLVLFDELGAGTDPAEGAALGRAIVETLMARGAKVVATTHYGELKLLRYELNGVANAAVEFDIETLSPTYRLLGGVSGQSNAVAIAERLGLEAPVVGRARELLATKATDVARLLEQMENDRHAAAEAMHQAEKAREKAEKLKRQYEEKMDKWQEERKALEAQAREKVEAQLRSAKGEIAAVIRELQGAKSGQSAQKANERLSKYAKYASRPQTGKSESAPRHEELQVGKTVFLAKLNQSGKVMTLPDAEGNLTVKVGVLTVNTHTRDLSFKNGALIPEPKVARQGGRVERVLEHVGLSHDLRGLLVHEALIEADRYLDAAFGAHLRAVTLVHGAGTGALRAALREWLARHPVVASFRPGGAGEGGDGATIVDLA